MEIKDIIERCKASLAEYYGTRFNGMVFNGSLARNQADPESDIDLLVLLQPPFDYFHELYRITRYERDNGSDSGNNAA